MKEFSERLSQDGGEAKASTMGAVGSAMLMGVSRAFPLVLYHCENIWEVSSFVSWYVMKIANPSSGWIPKRAERIFCSCVVL